MTEVSIYKYTRTAHKIDCKKDPLDTDRVCLSFVFSALGKSINHKYNAPWVGTIENGIRICCRIWLG